VLIAEITTAIVPHATISTTAFWSLAAIRIKIPLTLTAQMRNFFKQTFASVVGTLLGLFIFLGLGGLPCC